MEEDNNGSRRTLMSKYSPFAFYDWVKMLSDTFGRNLLLSLFFFQHLLKGLVAAGGSSGWVGTPIMYLYRDLGGITASRMQIYRAAAMTPWSMKSLMGFVSDLVPLKGYHKIPYLFGSTVAATAAYTILGFMWPLSARFTTGLLFIMFFQVALADLLTEAKYAEKLKEIPEHGPALMSFVWGGIFFFQLASMGTVGIIISELGPEWVYRFCIPFAAIMVVPLIFNWLGEKRDGGWCNIKLEKLRKERKLFFLSVEMGVASLYLAGLGIADVDETVQFINAMVIAVLLLASFAVCTPPIVAKVQAFFFIQHMCTISIESASFYFFTDTPEQYPEGPHFSPFFYTTVIGVVSAVFSIVGITLYQMLMKDWKYRTVFMITNLIFMAVNLFNVVVYLRWNVALGIPDTVFVLGSDAFQQIVQMWTWIPGIVILSQLCPEGVEATMYSLLAGSLNLGAGLAQYAGAFLLHALDVKPSGAANESKEFDNLWIAALIATLCPLVPLAFLPFLIPDARQTDRLLENEAYGVLEEAGLDDSFGTDSDEFELDFHVTAGNNKNDDQNTQNGRNSHAGESGDEAMPSDGVPIPAAVLTVPTVGHLGDGI